MPDDLFVLKEDADSGALKDGVSELKAPDVSPGDPVGRCFRTAPWQRRFFSREPEE